MEVELINLRVAFGTDAILCRCSLPADSGEINQNSKLQRAQGTIFCPLAGSEAGYQAEIAAIFKQRKCGACAE